MDRLHKQLQYFVSSKISTDTLWQGCKVILSGHESPGEGEHKIMDYIRCQCYQTICFFVADFVAKMSNSVLKISTRVLTNFR